MSLNEVEKKIQADLILEDQLVLLEHSEQGTKTAGSQVEDTLESDTAEKDYSSFDVS